MNNENLELLHNKITRNFTFVQDLINSEYINEIIERNGSPTIIDFIHGIVYTSIASASSENLRSLIKNDKNHDFHVKLENMITDLSEFYNCDKSDVTFILIKILTDYLVLIRE